MNDGAFNSRKMLLYFVLFTLLSSLLLFLPSSTVAAGGAIVEFDFSEFDRGAWVQTYTKGGVEMTVTVDNGCPTCPDKGIIFDTSNPGGIDYDLGSPNEDFGGPGLGTGGNNTSPGANYKSLGNSLIIPVNDVDNNGDGNVDRPNDTEDGGTITLAFDQDVTVNYFYVLDIEHETEGFVAEFFDVGNNSLGSEVATALGDNSYEEFVVNVPDVRSIVIELVGSGSMALMAVTPDPVTAGLGDYVWRDLDSNGIQNEGLEWGLNGVLVELMDSTCTTVLDTTFTANDSNGNPGFYQYLGLTPGTYSVRFHAPGGNYIDFTTANVGVVDSVDSDANVVTGCSHMVTLNAGDYDPTIDAGLVPDDPTAISLLSIAVNEIHAGTLILISVLLFAFLTGFYYLHTINQKQK